MMGGVFPTQVPGLLCGFYSKITIPETNLIWSAHGHFTRRAAGRTDVGEYQSELSKHGCREEKKIKMLWWCMRAYTAADSRGWGQCWRCSCVVQHQPYKLDVSMVQSRCFKSRSMWIAAAGRYRFQMVKAAACVWGERVSSITDTVCAQERKKKKQHISDNLIDIKADGKCGVHLWVKPELNHNNHSCSCGKTSA